MFQFSGSFLIYLFIQYMILQYCCSGFPHSDICGSMDICSSPQLFAACHVLRRLLMPRHSPYALYSLILRPSQRTFVLAWFSWIMWVSHIGYLFFAFDTSCLRILVTLFAIWKNLYFFLLFLFSIFKHRRTNSPFCLFAIRKYRSYRRLLLFPKKCISLALFGSPVSAFAFTKLKHLMMPEK